MALIQCPECGREVSDSAMQCPNCGFDVAKFVNRQRKIEQIQEASEREAYEYVKQKMREKQKNEEQARKNEENRKEAIYIEAIKKFESSFSKDVEEAEYLFKSIIDWENSRAFNEKCRLRIEELRENERAEELKNKKKKKIVIGIAAIVGVAIIIVGVIIYCFQEQKKSKQYSEAQRLVSESNNYQAAITLLEKNPDYQDSRWLITEYQNEILYQNALKLLKDGKYDEAKTYFQSLDNYKDSVAIIERITKYEEAIGCFQNAEFETAYNLFVELNNLANSQEYALKCQSIISSEEKALTNAAFKLNDFLGKNGLDYLFVDIYDEKYVSKVEFKDLGMEPFHYHFESVEDAKKLILKNVNKNSKDYNSYEEYLEKSCEELPITLKLLYDCVSINDVKTIGVQFVFNSNHKYQLLWNDSFDICDMESNIQTLSFRLYDKENDRVLQETGPYKRIE